MTSAFISHHSAQHETARTLKAALARAGIDGWMAPDDIAPGVTFDQAIIDQIGRSDFVVLLLCAGADQSRHVKRELMIAEDAGKPVYPVRLEPLEPKGLAYWLKDTQWTDWFGRDAAGADRLVGAIQRQGEAPTAIGTRLTARARWSGRTVALLAGLAILLGGALGAGAWFYWGGGATDEADFVIEPGRWIARRDVTQIVFPEVPPEVGRQLEAMFENDPNPEECIPEAVARQPGVRLFDPGGEGRCTLTSFEMAAGRMSGYLSCPIPGASDGSVMTVTFRGTYTRTTIETDNDITLARPDGLFRLRSRDSSQWVGRDCSAEQGRQ